MRILLLTAFLMVSATAGIASGSRIRQQPETNPDTMAGVGKVIHILTDYYEPFDGDLGGFGMHRGSLMTDGPTSLCEADAGEICFGDDPDRGPCPAGSSCHPPPEFLLEGLYETAMENPESDFVLGQAIFALVKYGLSTRAMILVDRCGARDWWCAMLHGYVLHAQGRFAEAQDEFRKGLAGAPISDRCEWEDATWLLGRWDPVSSQQTLRPGLLPEGHLQTRDWPCLDRLDASRILWWLSDPLYSSEGNERWVEHIARSLMLRFQRQMWEARRMPTDSFQWLPIREALRWRRGTWDSYRKPYQTGYAFWTGEAGARYHFVPDVEPSVLRPDLDSLLPRDLTDARVGAPVEEPDPGFPDPEKIRWRLMGDIWDEGFSPPFGPIVPLPVQIARFRRGDSLLVAAAGALGGTELEGRPEATAHLILTDGPDRFPLHLRAPANRRTVVFLGTAPMAPYVAGFEVQGARGIGWHRQTLRSLNPSEPGISDLLLYRPSPRLAADSLMAAVALMAGTHEVPVDSRLGVFWEIYGVEGSQTLEMELALEGDGGGVIDAITGLLPGMEQERRAPVHWSEPAGPGTKSGSLVLNLRGVDPGRYTLVLKAAWPGQGTMERRREVQVTGGG